MLNITFTATVRTAVVSAIDFTPVLQPASGTPCPTTAPGPTLYAQMPDGSCLPYVIIGSTLTRPSVLIGMNVDPFPGRAELYFLEYRETGHYGDADRTYWIPGFDCSQKPPPVGSGAINPDTGLLADCMHGSMLVAIK